MNKEVNKEQMPFTKKNYITILVGVVLLFIGFLLMSGGGEHTATEFDSSIFSFRRITLAPVVVIAGFVVVGFGIMKRFKDKE
ncbi:MAG: DUF3098 domain-containing protein [Alistipes sp.]|nr:DUF3098 domain-containing protein [Alistipes sp.]